MPFWNKIQSVKKSWVWPDEDIQRIETTSLTDVEGEIIINYANITQVNTSTISIFLVTPPLVPATQFTRTGIELFTGPEFDLDPFGLGDGRMQLNFKFNTNILLPTTGEFYLVSIGINSLITIDFIIKIVDVGI